MYLYYANLVHFTTSPTYGNMYEASITEKVLSWVGEAQEQLSNDYNFSVEYIYNQPGIIVDANINVQKKINDEWKSLGIYSPLGTVTLSSIICHPQIEDDCCVPSDIPSDPIHYYVKGYYQDGYYV